MKGKNKMLLVLPALMAGLSVVLSIKLFSTGVLPVLYPIIFLCFIALFVAGFSLAILKNRRAISTILSVLTILIVAVLGYGYAAFAKVDSTLNDISVNVACDKTAVSVVTLSDSDISSIEELSGRNIALCETAESVKIATDVKSSVKEAAQFTKGFQNMELVDALLNKYVDAIIIDDAYLDIVSGFEGYEEFENQIKVLSTYEVTEVPADVVFAFDKEMLIEAVRTDENGDGTEVASIDSVAVSGVTTVDASSDSTGSSTGTTAGNVASGSYSTTPQGSTAKAVTVNTGGIANSTNGAHTSSLNWGDDIITSKEGTFIAYVSGIDTTGSVNVKRRSDVNILAVINLNTGTIQLIDTPRDYFVILPQVGKADKLTHAGIYGVDYSIAALERLYGIKVDYYLRMNFTGFVKMIDTIGGVDVYSDYEFTVEPVKTYTVGLNHLNGIEALAFARERYTFTSGDIQRGKNQMKVINGLVQKLSSPEVVVNYAGILDCVSDSFQTDMPTDVMYRIISNQISRGTSWTVNSMVSSGYGSSSTTYSAPTKVGYVMNPNDDDVATAHELIRNVVGK